MRAIVLQHTPTEGPERVATALAARGVTAGRAPGLRGCAGAGGRRRRRAADRRWAADGRRRRRAIPGSRSSRRRSRFCASWSRATRPCWASVWARSCWRRRRARASTPTCAPAPTGEPWRRARSAGARSTCSAPTGEPALAGLPREAAGAALARRHLRPAGRRGPPGVDADLPQPGVPAGSPPVRPAVPLRAGRERPSRVWAREDADFVRGALGPDGARSDRRGHGSAVRAARPSGIACWATRWTSCSDRRSR